MRNKVALLLSITGILVLGLIGWQLYKISTFHIVSTTPKLSAVSRISPYVKINFNDVLFEDGLKISDPAGIISGKSIKDKTLTLNFTNELKVDQEYTITLDSISNIGGELITNKKLTFTVKDIKTDKLSDAENKTLVARQDQPVYDVEHLNYPNFESLLDNGVSSDQLRNIKAGLFDYSNVVKKQFWTMTLQPGSVAASHAQGSTTTTVDFNVTLDAPYRAHVEYNVLYDPVHLQLYNAGNTLMYDSANGSD